MDTNYDSTDRKPADYFLFGLSFLGFIIGLSGVIVASVPAGFIGLILLLLPILSYQLRLSPGE
jgi:hypothetical protein